ncbi:MAG: glycosyltransferase family 2 protein [Gammaproteobacteria bacterium]|nr:glycosyltransferase family 2 protein [Gammaproteobacteria bacterium]
MKRPKVSVVLCTYNGEKYITQQIESILNQSIPPDELIISDDCSSDCTVDIVNDLANAYPATIRFIQCKKNIGFIKNFEKTISLAEGEVIFLSDHDDVWFEHKIEYMLQPFIDHKDIGLVYSDAVITNSELESIGHTLFGRRNSMKLDKMRTAPMLIKDVGINGCTMAFRSVLKELVFPIGEGWGHEHWIAFIAYAIMAVMPVDKPLMYYRRHGISAGNDPLLEGGRIRVWKTGITEASLNEYERDFCRWEVMFRRLHEIKLKRSVAWINYTNLDAYLSECGRRTELARLRKKMKEKGRRNRLPDVFRIFFAGYYYQYLHGVKSLAKDLLIR